MWQKGRRGVANRKHENRKGDSNRKSGALRVQDVVTRIAEENRPNDGNKTPEVDHVKDSQLRDDLQLDTIPLKKETEKWEATYLQINFEDIIAEPEGTRSPECVWKNAQKVYSASKNYCYSFLSVLCAIPISFFVGISFACVTFQHVWCLGPAVRHFKVACHVTRQYVVTCLESCCAPCCAVMGLFFSRISVSQGGGKPSSRQFV